MAKRKKRAASGVIGLLAVVLVLLVLLVAGACGLLFGRFTWVAGGFREKGSQQLDLRGEAISLEAYQQLTQAFPGREILWDVPFRHGRVTSDAAAVTLSELSGTDWQCLELLPNLTQLNAAGCRDYQSLLDFQTRHPDCQVRYTVLLGGREIPNDAQSITLEGAEGLEQLLPSLPSLTQVEFTGTAPEEETLGRLIASFPDISFRWHLTEGTAMDSAATELDLHGKKLGFEEVRRLLALLPKLRQVNLLGCPLEDSQVLQLVEENPRVQFLWELRLGSQTCPTDIEELDISGWQLESTQQIEKYLPCFYNLKRVIMCGCGLDDETMDALNRKYEDIRFIWSVRIQDVEIRTDAKWFYPFKYQHDMVVVEEDLYPLRYCTDMEAIDIGHMFGVKNCDWVAFMPNLEYLIIGETGITDLSPLTNLKRLKYLEMFTIAVTDYSPLLGCTALEDLNLGKTYGDPSVIAQMTWLKNLWWCDAATAYNPRWPEAIAQMQEALTDTRVVIYIDHPTAGGWRQLDNYYAMRDLMEVFYLT